MSHNNKHINPLTSADGCISQDALKRYIDNQLTTTEKEAIEMHAHQCELCADALEGAKLMSSGEAMINDVAFLQKEISEKATPNKTRLFLPIISVAATVLIVIGIFFIYNKHNQTTLVAENKIEEEKDIKTKDVKKDASPESTIEAPAEMKEKTQEIDNKRETKEVATNQPINKLTYRVQKVEEQPAIVYAELEEFEALEIAADDAEILDEITLDEIGNYEIVIADQDKKEVPENKGYLADIETNDNKDVYSGNVSEYNTGEKNSDVSRLEGAKAKKSQNRAADRNYVEIEEPAQSGTLKSVVAEEELDEDHVFLAEKMPSFQDGDIQKFKDWIYTRLNYELPVNEANSTKYIIVKFQVDKNGEVNNVTTVKSLNKEFDDKVVDIIKSSPKWQPAEQNGKVIKIELAVKIVKIAED